MLNKVKKILKTKKKSPPVSTSTTISGSDDTKVASYVKRRMIKGSCNNCCISNCICDSIGGCFDWCGDCCCGNKNDCCYDECQENGYNNNNCCDCGVIGCQCDLGQCGSCCC